MAKRQTNRYAVAVGVAFAVAATLFTVATMIGPRYDVVPAAVWWLATGTWGGRLIEARLVRRGKGLLPHAVVAEQSALDR